MKNTNSKCYQLGNYLFARFIVNLMWHVNHYYTNAGHRRIYS